MTERTGLIAFWKNYDRQLYLKAAILADELGYDSFWIPEAWGYEIFSLLTEMAVHTKRIKLGTGIVNVFSRTPGLVAMNAATVGTPMSPSVPAKGAKLLSVCRALDSARAECYSQASTLVSASTVWA